MATAQSSRTCPSCSAVMSASARACPICKMEVSKMAAFEAAKRAALQRGVRRTQVEERPRISIGGKEIAIGVVACVLIFVVAWWLTRPAAQPYWMSLPSSEVEAAQLLFNDVHADNAKAIDHAYSMIDPTVKDRKTDDEKGLYGQLYRTMDRYLQSEIGSDWFTIMKLEKSKTNPDTVEAHIGAESLHVRVSNQTPADKAHLGNHFAIMGIDEFGINDAAAMQSLAGQLSVVQGVAGKGAVDNLRTILGASAGPRHETPMMTKLRILPNIRDPRVATRRNMLQAWKVRTDPVVRARLEKVVNDGRYAGDLQQTARDILRDTVSDEDLAAAGVE